MKELLTDSEMLRHVEQGLGRAVSALPSGRLQGGRLVFRGGAIRLFLNDEFEGTDGFLITPYLKDYLITAATPFGFVSGVATAVWNIRRGVQPTGPRIPRFKSRFYKHETNLGQGPQARPVPHTHIAELDDAFWGEYCSALASRHFDGLVFYSTWHPFQYLLDYDRYREAGAGTKRQRAATLAGLKRAIGIARSFGIKTYLQHHMTFMPQAIAAKYLPGICNYRNVEWLGGVDHPAVVDYNRYVYRRTFELLPELTGLFVNLENVPNSADIVERHLLCEVARVKPLPELTFMLSGFCSLPEMAKIVKSYPGKVRLTQGIMDMADVYYFPKADRRVMEWKKALPDTEFVFIVGPCYNSASAQSRTLWCDPEFVKATLADAEKKGTDSVAFHTVYDLFCDDISASKLAGQGEIQMALMNRGHIEGFLEFVRGRTPIRDYSVIRERYESRLSRRLGLSRRQTELVYGSMRESSRISLLIFQQFLMSLRTEGRIWAMRRNTYADPFMYPTMTVVNEQPRLAMDVQGLWLNTTNSAKYVPEDVQRVIDYVDPSQPRVARDPLVMARLIARHSSAAMSMAVRAVGRKPMGIAATFMENTIRMNHWGMRMCHEIRAAAGIYAAFFPTSKRRTSARLRTALAELKECARHSAKDDPLSARNVPILRESQPEKDIAILRSLIKHLSKDDYPYAAFAAYAGSLREYNEIRRTVRPARQIRPRETDIIRRQLRASLRAAGEAINLLQGRSCMKLAANVGKWVEYLEAELAGLTPPEYRVSRDGAPGDGFVQLWHDQCFRHGENCISDLSAFFTPTDFPRRERIFMSLAARPDGLGILLKEEGVDVAEREARWDDWKGSLSDTFFLRLYLLRDYQSMRVECFKIQSRGRWCSKKAATILGRQDVTCEHMRVIETAAKSFHRGADWWRVDVTIPWNEVGGIPESGARWRANVTANPAIRVNRQSVWCPGYDFFAGKFSRMGTLIFA